MANEKEASEDGLSGLLRRLSFKATVFLKADFCGMWAVDTSGDRRVPFHLVTQGTGWLHLEGQEPQELQSGHLVLFPQDAPHVLAASRNEPPPELINLGPPEKIEGEVTRLVCGYFNFERRAAMPLLKSLPRTMILKLDDPESGLAPEVVRMWMIEANSEEMGSAIAIDLLAELVFIHVLRTSIKSASLPGVIGALSDSRLGPVLVDIHEDPGAGHKIDILAAKSGMSESAFGQRFKRVLGMTPGQYVKHWRMHTAHRLLRESDASMAQISDQMGYESEVAFRKAFKSFFDITPGKVRKSRTGKKSKNRS